MLRNGLEKRQKLSPLLESGQSIELNQAQMMSFYLLMKREQARGHIFGLGIKAAPIITVDKKRYQAHFKTV